MQCLVHIILVNKDLCFFFTLNAHRIANSFVSFSTFLCVQSRNIFSPFFSYHLLLGQWRSPNSDKTNPHLFNFSASLVFFYSLRKEKKQKKRGPNLNKVNSTVPLHFPYPQHALKPGLFIKQVTAQGFEVCGVEEGSPLGNIHPPCSDEGPPRASFFSLFVFCCKTTRARPLFPTAACRLKC